MPALVDENGRVFYSDAQIDIAKRLHNPNYDQPTLPIFKEVTTMSDNKDFLDEAAKLIDDVRAAQDDDEIQIDESQGEISSKRYNTWCDMLKAIKDGDLNTVNNLRREFQNFVGVTVTRQHVIDLAQSDFDAFRAWLAQYDMHFVTKDGEVQRLVKYEDGKFHFENLADADAAIAPTVDTEFKTLIPSLTETEFAQLEANILRDGIREPLTVWRDHNILVDGHHRLAIAQKHGLEFKTIEVDFADRDAVKMWIFENQVGRRNANKFVRGELALKLEPSIAARAKENLSTHTADGYQRLANLPKGESIDTRSELAKIAGVSPRTMATIKYLVDNASEEIKAALRADRFSVNAALKAVKAGAQTADDVDRFNAARREQSAQSAIETPATVDTEPARDAESHVAVDDTIDTTNVDDTPIDESTAVDTHDVEVTDNTTDIEDVDGQRICNGKIKAVYVNTDDDTDTVTNDTTNAATSVDNTEIADSAQIDDTDFDGVESHGDTGDDADESREVTYDDPFLGNSYVESIRDEISALLVHIEALMYRADEDDLIVAKAGLAGIAATLKKKTPVDTDRRDER